MGAPCATTAWGRRRAMMVARVRCAGCAGGQGELEQPVETTVAQLHDRRVSSSIAPLVEMERAAITVATTLTAPRAVYQPPTFLCTPPVRELPR
jgi:hypothetical protein